MEKAKKVKEAAKARFERKIVELEIQKENLEGNTFYSESEKCVAIIKLNAQIEILEKIKEDVIFWMNLELAKK